MSRRTREEQIEVLVHRFADAVMRQDEEIQHGSAARGNRQAKRYIGAFRRLRMLYGDDGREALKRLFLHENEGVRSMAAAYLLRYCTGEAMSVLEYLVKYGHGFAPIEAFYCMKNWEEGTWALDPDPGPADEGGGDDCNDR